MAKQQAHKTFSEVIPSGTVYWFVELNEARGTEDYGTEKELLDLRSRLVENGWAMATYGAIDVEPIRKDLYDRAMEARRVQWESLKDKANSNAEMALRLKVFEMLYTDKGKKLIELKYSGISGNRRGTVFFDAMVERLRKNLDVSMQIPAVIYPADLSAADRLEIQCMENEMKDAGAKEMSNGDRCRAARKRLDLGGKEADLARMFKRGMAQKLWSIARLDALWPEMEIVKRIGLPLEADGAIPFGPLDKEVMRLLAIRSDPEALKNFNIIEGAKTGKTAEPATKEQVEAYFGNPRAGKPQSGGRTLDKAVVTAQATGNGNRLIREVLGGVASNNIDPLKKYDAHSVLLNGTLDLIDSGDGPQLELLVAKLVVAKNGARQELFKKLIEAAS